MRIFLITEINSQSIQAGYICCGVGEGGGGGGVVVGVGGIQVAEEERLVNGIPKVVGTRRFLSLRFASTNCLWVSKDGTWDI